MSPGVDLPLPEDPNPLRRYELEFRDDRPPLVLQAADCRTSGDDYVFYDLDGHEVERISKASVRTMVVT